METTENTESVTYAPYHEWGDDWPYWDDLYRAEKFIYTWTYRLAGLRLLSKEKYGTIRYEYLFGLGKSGVFMRTTPWVDKVARYFPIIRTYQYRLFQCAPILYKLRKAIFRGVVHLAVYKYPQCRNEILSDLDYI